MKKSYPFYKQGELNKVEKKLSKKDKEILQDFLKKCSITAGEKKVQHIKKLILQLFDVTQKPLTEQNKESIDAFLSLLSNCKKSYWTKDEIRIYIKQFILWYYKDFAMVENIKAESKKGLNPQKVTENNLITEKDMEKMLRFAQGYKDKAYLLLGFWSGARPQEILNLKWKDIKFDNETADITLYSNKTERSRTFPVVKETMKALWEWKQHYSFPDVSPNDYVFVSRWKNKAMTTAGLNKMLRKMAKASGIEKDVWSYLLRHSRATRLYEELPQQIVEKLMGHKNMASVYAHISSRKAKEELLKKIYHVTDLVSEDYNNAVKEQLMLQKQLILEQNKQILKLMQQSKYANSKDIKKILEIQNKL